MIDQDDVGDFLADAPVPTTWLGLAFYLAIVGFLVAMCSMNQDECARIKCANGAPAELMHHECLCVERPQQ